jgi:hypothetical protein
MLYCIFLSRVFIFSLIKKIKVKNVYYIKEKLLFNNNDENKYFNRYYRDRKFFNRINNYYRGFKHFIYKFITL